MTTTESVKAIYNKTKRIRNFFITHPFINERCLYLYNLGHNDRHISLKLNKKFNTTFSSEDIRYWRKINNLSPTGSFSNLSCKITNKVADKIISMRKWGGSIEEISFELGISPGRLAIWLNSNYKLREEKNKIKMELYRKGLLDSEIADILKINKNSIFVWRKKYNLPSNYTP